METGVILLVIYNLYYIRTKLFRNTKLQVCTYLCTLYLRYTRYIGRYGGIGTQILHFSKIKIILFY